MPETMKFANMEQMKYYLDTQTKLAIDRKAAKDKIAQDKALKRDEENKKIIEREEQAVAIDEQRVHLSSYGQPRFMDTYNPQANKTNWLPIAAIGLVLLMIFKK